jgi:hypothetical protein
MVGTPGCGLEILRLGGDGVVRGAMGRGCEGGVGEEEDERSGDDSFAVRDEMVANGDEGLGKGGVKRWLFVHSTVFSIPG